MAVSRSLLLNCSSSYSNFLKACGSATFVSLESARVKTTKQEFTVHKMVIRKYNFIAPELPYLKQLMHLY